MNTFEDLQQQISTQIEQQMRDYFAARQIPHPSTKNFLVKSGSNLTLIQEMMLPVILSPSRRKKLFNKKVRIVKTSDGARIREEDQKIGKISAISISPLDTQTASVIFTIQTGFLKNANFSLYEIELENLTDVFSLREIKKNFEDLLIKQVAEYHNRDFRNLTNDLASVNSQIQACKLTLAELEDKKEKTETQIKKIKTPSVPKNFLEDQFDLIKKHKKVNNFYITRGGNFVIETKDLNTIDPETNEENDENIGRFRIWIPIESENRIQAENMDYEACGHDHPNLDGTSICFGGNNKEVYNLLERREFFQLVDFIIFFFSLFPQDESNPYINYDDWLSMKISHPDSKELAADPLW